VKRPALLNDHPNFFFVYCAVGLFHGALGAIGTAGSDQRFASEALQDVNRFAAHEVWGMASLVLVVLLAFGLWTHGHAMSRVALAAGGGLALLRFVLIAAPLIDGRAVAGLTALPMWGLIAALHFALAAEPPFNPVTAK
jgi:hypothetical protein